MFLVNDIDMGKICNRLRYALLEKKVSFQRAARELGVSKDLIFDYTNPDYSESSMQAQTLIKIADYCGKDKYYFCNEYHKFIDSCDVKHFLHEERAKYKMTQKQFADFLGVTLASYKRYEEGMGRLPMAAFEKLKDKKRVKE